MKSGEEDVFARSLDELKRGGCGILVVGAPSAQARRTASARLLGDAVVRPRRRLFVFTDRTYTHERLGNGPTEPDTVRVVSRAAATRYAASTGGPVDVDDSLPHRRVRSDRLGEFARAVGEEIRTFESRAGSLDPGELRVCFDSLSPLLSAHREESVHRFVNELASRTRAVAGMVHFHLGVERDDPIALRLAPLFDAVIELRVRDGPEQRWHLPERDYRSGWLPF
ncbi:DUF7504 family protein [Halegenticoccus tardaugens]|uniref:DUF7504 family protein n=1 Tax=Halegenticoccus tardaugens TaxID=2071624 RepID=UPI00100BA8F3|nr:hypothetical protein [Halegenticoccus tardaugens]